MQDMRHDVDARIIPFDKLAVVPDFGGDTWGRHVFGFAVFWKHYFVLLWNSIFEERRARRLQFLGSRLMKNDQYGNVPTVALALGLSDMARYRKRAPLCKGRLITAGAGAYHQGVLVSRS